MADLIDRQAVQEMVDRIGGMYPYRQIGNRDSYSQYNEAWADAINRVDAELNSLPSAQPEQIRTQMSLANCISRQDAIDALDNIKIPRNASWYPYYQQALTAMSRLPSAYPETDSFCDGCKEYDQKRNFCPRFDRVIKKTVEEMGIIHCKDCKHWMPYDWMFSEMWQSKNMNDYPEKEIGCAYCDMNMGANDFCSRAERLEK